MRGGVIAALCAAIFTFTFSTSAQAQRFRPWVRDQIETLDNRVTQAEMDIIDLSGAVVALATSQPGAPPAMGSRFVVVDADGFELGPATLLPNGKVRTIIDVAGVGLVACDVRGAEVEALKPVNSDLVNEVYWTGPGCTGTPFNGGRVWVPGSAIPAYVSVVGVLSGTYTLGQDLGQLTAESAESESLCQEMQLPFAPRSAFEVIRVGEFIGVTHPAPYTLELR